MTLVETVDLTDMLYGKRDSDDHEVILLCIYIVQFVSAV